MIHLCGTGSAVREDIVPKEMEADVTEKRNELIHLVADVDEEVGDLFISEEPITPEVLTAAIRRATVSRAFIPVFMGSAFKNKGTDPNYERSLSKKLLSRCSGSIGWRPVISAISARSQEYCIGC